MTIPAWNENVLGISTRGTSPRVLFQPGPFYTLFDPTGGMLIAYVRRPPGPAFCPRPSSVKDCYPGLVRWLACRIMVPAYMQEMAAKEMEHGAQPELLIPL